MGRKMRKSGRKVEMAVHDVVDHLEKFGLMMMMHFPNVEPGDVDALSCGMCQDRKAGVCSGRGFHGPEVLLCMEEHCESARIVQSVRFH